MLRPQDDIYVTLPSNVPGVPRNKPSNLKTVLPTPLKLNGAWEVAVLETHYPHQIPNFKATTLVVICTEDSEKPQLDQPQPYWMQPQPLQSPRGQAHRDEVNGSYPSGEDEELDPGVRRYRAHDGPAPITPQPQTASQSLTSTEIDKKQEQPKREEKKHEPAKEGKAAKIDTDTPPAEKKEEDVKKPEDAGKKPREDAAKKTSKSLHQRTRRLTRRRHSRSLMRMQQRRRQKRTVKKNSQTT